MPVDMKFNPSSPIHTKVAVVGGGVSGIYSAWRLTVDSQELPIGDVKVFEFGNRVGGRLETVFLKGVEERRAEVGGMRFIPSWQLHVQSLIEHLKLRTASFPMGDDNNLFFLRGESFRNPSFLYATTPYRLRGSEQGLSPDELFVKILNTLLASVGKQIKKTAQGYTGPSRQEWDEIKKNPDFQFGGKRLVDQGFWNILDQMLTSEAYKLLTDAGGYYTLTANWNAAEAASFIGLDFIGASYKTLEQGYDAQVGELAQRFTQQGGEIWGYSELIRFDRGDDGKLKLTFRNRNPELAGSQTDAIFEVITEHLVLAMPRHGLERLQLHHSFFDFDAPRNREQRELRDAVLKMPAFKLFMGYKEAWWSRLELSSGRSICDLPIRQTYYFGTDKSDAHSLLMTSYNDAEAVSFWKGLQVGAKARYISPNTVSTKYPEHYDTYEATDEMLRRASSQLRDLHGVEVPPPIASAYKDWGAEPFGAGWFLWKSGQKSWEVMPRMRRPWPKENVYVCGDCYSTLQGWVEGALNTAELMLEEHFKLGRPSWLDKKAYLGY